jgi:citrate lyase subunit beta/citryl-CoA lyase
MGFTGMTTFYPSHIAVIHDVFTPAIAEVAHAKKVVDAYERVLADGRAALQVDGQVVLVHDYEKAKTILEEAAMPSGHEDLSSSRGQAANEDDRC